MPLSPPFARLLRCLASSVFWLALLAGLGGRAAAPKPPTRPWQSLTRCTLLTNAFHDADSFQVRVGTNLHIFRLAYVDTPETDARFPTRNLEQAQHFGLSTNRIPAAGQAAREVSQRLLARPFTVQTRWANALGSSRQPRFYAIVTLPDGSDLGEVLVQRGWARPKGLGMNRPDGTRNTVYRAHLESLEQAARDARVGLWNQDWHRPARPAAPANPPARVRRPPPR
jgi:endonuclease YncB( thermonuclease family)